MFSCRGSYPTGLYPISALRVPVYGPKQTDFPSAAPQEMPEEWVHSLADEVDIVASEDRCFHQDTELERLRFDKVVTRGRPGGNRGQLYSIWFKR